MSEHTPGPWYFDGLVQIVEVERPHMRVAFLPSDHDEYASSKPNGRLIAAAPDMLAALYEVACPRPANAVSEGVSLTVRECIGRNECGCTFGIAVKKATETDIERKVTNP